MIEELIEMRKQGVSELEEANNALDGHAFVKDKLFHPSTEVPNLGSDGCLHSSVMVAAGSWRSCSVR